MKQILTKLFLLILLVIACRMAPAQDNYVDSLEKVLLTEKEDTNKINTLDYLYIYHYWTDRDYEKAMQNSMAALALAIKINYKPGIADGYLKLGTAYGAKKDQFNESEYFKKALALYVEAGNKQNTIDCYDRMATAYSLESNFGKAVECSYDAQKIREQTGNKKLIAEGFHNIVNILGYSPDNSEEIIKNSLYALKLDKELDNKKGIGECLSSIGSAYSSQRKYPEALDKFAEALQTFKDLGIPTQIEMINEGIADIYEKQGDSAYGSQNKSEAAYKYQKAEESELIALNISRSEYPINIAVCFSGLGQIDIKLGKLTQAKNYLDSSLKINKEYSLYLSISRDYYNLSRIDSLQGNYKNAYKNYQLFHIYNDSVKTEEDTKATVQAQMKYDYEKKQAIAKAEQDKKDADAKRIKSQQYFAIASLGVVMFAVLVIAFIQFRNNKQKQKANKLITKQKEKVEATLEELKSTQSQLIQSEKMASLGELTAGIAHEIQNPLNFVNNFSEVSTELIDEMKDELSKSNYEDANAIADDLKQNLEKINHHGRRAGNIVKGMLQHSQASTGKKEPTDINSLCDEYLRLAYHGLRAKDKDFNAKMETDFDSSIGKANIIAQDIGRVLLNLINNAFYAVNEKSKQNIPGYYPTVSVSTKKETGKISISVEDNGNGIPESIKEKIFQPFFTTKPTGSGTGLGLSLGYDIVKAHGGEIKVQTKEGEGTEFMIQLPVV